jgi:hypothetical protein
MIIPYLQEGYAVDPGVVHGSRCWVQSRKVKMLLIVSYPPLFRSSARNDPVYGGIQYRNFFLFLIFIPALIYIYLSIYILTFFRRYILVSLLRIILTLLNVHFEHCSVLNFTSWRFTGKILWWSLFCCAVACQESEERRNCLHFFHLNSIITDFLNLSISTDLRLPWVVML